MKDKDSKNIWYGYQDNKSITLIEALTEELESRGELLTEDNRLDNPHHRKEVEKMEDENPQLGYMRAKAKREEGMELTDDDNAILAQFEGDSGSQQGGIDGYQWLIADTLGADEVDGISTLLDPSVGSSTHKFVREIASQLLNSDLEDEEKLYSWLDSILPGSPTTGMPFTDGQMSSLKRFFDRFLHKIFAVVQFNGEEAAEGEIRLFLQALNELTEMHPDDINRLGAYRLNDPE